MIDWWSLRRSPLNRILRESEQTLSVSGRTTNHLHLYSFTSAFASICALMAFPVSIIVSVPVRVHCHDVYTSVRAYTVKKTALFFKSTVSRSLRRFVRLELASRICVHSMTADGGGLDEDVIHERITAPRTSHTFTHRTMRHNDPPPRCTGDSACHCSPHVLINFSTVEHTDAFHVEALRHESRAQHALRCYRRGLIWKLEGISHCRPRIVLHRRHHQAPVGVFISDSYHACMDVHIQMRHDLMFVQFSPCP